MAVAVGELSYTRTAAVAGVPEGTAMSRLQRARQRTSEHLERERLELGRNP